MVMPLVILMRRLLICAFATLLLRSNKTRYRYEKKNET